MLAEVLITQVTYSYNYETGMLFMDTKTSVHWTDGSFFVRRASRGSTRPDPQPEIFNVL